jgi:5-formyltetrahydrofolate cyclo-ligase
MLEFHRSSIFLYTYRMEKELALQELQRLVSQRTASILYKPTKTEVDYNNPSFPLEVHANNLLIPNTRDSDPFEWVINCITKFKNAKVCILIPGTEFDLYGTRHGKGAGWYDRFLSKTSAWLRIGIIDKSKISHSKMLRQKWDEPVDWVITYDGSSWRAHKARVENIVI